MANGLASIISDLHAGYAMRFEPPTHVVPADGESRGGFTTIPYPVLPGRYPLVSSYPNVSMLKGESGEALSLSRLLERAPDVFLGSGVTAKTLGFEVSRWLPGTWNSNIVLRELRELFEGEGQEELKAMLHDMRALLEQGEARDKFAAVRQLRKTLGSLNGTGPTSGDLLASVQQLYERMQEGAFAVRANFPTRGESLAGTTLAISSLNEGESVLLGLKKRFDGNVWQEIKNGGDTVRTRMQAHNTAEPKMLFVDWGIPFGLAGAVRAVMVEPSSSEIKRVFLDDWDRRSSAKLIARIDKGKAAQLQSLAPMPDDEVNNIFVAPTMSGAHRVFETHTPAYHATRVQFADKVEEPFEMPLMGAAAYVVAVGGDITISTRAQSSQALGLQVYQAAIVPPMAEVLSVSGKGSFPTALIVRPV